MHVILDVAALIATVDLQLTAEDQGLRYEDPQLHLDGACKSTVALQTATSRITCTTTARESRRAYNVVKTNHSFEYR